MNRIARLIGLAAVLLTIFLAVVLASWVRLRRQTELVHKAAVETRQLQLERALALTQPTALPWSDAYIRELNTILDAHIKVLNPNEQKISETKTDAWYFEYVLKDNTGQPQAILQVNFSQPPSFRLGALYRQAALILLILALGIIAIVVIAMIFSLEHRQTLIEDPAQKRTTQNNEFDSLTHLAKVSTKQRLELEHERSERVRADEDLHFQQVLLNRSLEEKIQLGRELHDGIIQSLYATGLTFEAARKHLVNIPAETAQQLDEGLKALNATIRDVRSYISGLAPENLRQQSFSSSVASLTQNLNGSRAVIFDVRIDEHAAATLTDPQSTDLLQIIRESISNSLRHGAAKKITVRLHQSANELGLLIQDDGSGFDEKLLNNQGHGLNNIKARADRIQAELRISSTAGEGTRIVLTLPVSTENKS